jgi:hypothetical protein
VFLAIMNARPRVWVARHDDQRKMDFLSIGAEV